MEVLNRLVDMMDYHQMYMTRVKNVLKENHTRAVGKKNVLTALVNWNPFTEYSPIINFGRILTPSLIITDKFFRLASYH